MEYKDEVVIPLSKIKIILLIVGSAVFVAGGVWLLGLDPEQIQSSRRMSNPQIAYGVGYVCIAFFGICGIYGITKMFDFKPGLIINSKGITDNSSAVAAGLIRWSDITGFSEFQVKSTKMLIIHVREPEKYVNRGSAIKRALNKANMKLVGSPISISANSLRIKYPELLELCTNRFEKQGQDA